MRPDSRLSRVTHLLLRMARTERGFTAAQMAVVLGTRADVARLTMAGLRRRGYVAFAQKSKGGWYLIRPLTDITLLDVHDAIGRDNVFAVRTARTQVGGVIEATVNAVIEQALVRANNSLRTELAKIYLSELAQAAGGEGDEGRL